MPRVLLVVLLLRPNEVIRSDRLVEDLWAGEPPPCGTKGLQVHVSRLRHALAAGRSDPHHERLVTTAGGYLLKVGPDELDATRCERLIAEARSLVAAGRCSGATLRDRRCPPPGWEPVVSANSGTGTSARLPIRARRGRGGLRLDVRSNPGADCIDRGADAVPRGRRRAQ
jgi:hypothetical protein